MNATYSFYLEGEQIEDPEGFDGSQFKSEYSDAYGGFFFADKGGANVNDVTLTSRDTYTVNTLLRAYDKFGVKAKVEFEVRYCGKKVYSGLIDFNDFEQSDCCEVRYTVKSTVEETVLNKRMIKYGLTPATDVTFNGKFISGKATHALDDTKNPKNGTGAYTHYPPYKVESNSLSGSVADVDGSLFKNESGTAKDIIVSGILKVKALGANPFNYAVVLEIRNSANALVSSNRLGGGSSATAAFSYSLYWTGQLQNNEVVSIRMQQLTSPYAGTWGFNYEAASLTFEYANFADIAPTVARGILVKDAFVELLQKMETRYTFCSDFFTTGCGRNVWITNGYGLRGVVRPINVSMEWLFVNLNKIFYLGCNDQKDCIRIEGRIEQCDNAFVIKDYESARIMPAKEYLLKSITAGYIKWQSDTPYGTDEFNANHTYELGGNEGTLSLSSELIGSGYLIEKIRRQSEPTKDYPTDEDIFIVCVLPTGAGYVAETTENFENEAGIISPTTAYNLRITPSRIMDNWQPYWDNGNDAVMTSYEGNAGLVATCTDECTAKAEVAENETKVSSGRKSRGAFELVFRGEWPLYNKIGSCVRFDYCGRQYTGYLRSKHMNVNILKKGEIILKGILT